ncbi:GatB/YqeY domain-containing protein [Engelhardtia mirabilis]|uniref:Yqey-like protein n=1 Tax=Engelhardtia mirabilis TaxID=2528011 RepID=A0A518BSZ2_9BACT|nr:Yqey-like protein [Planctomycetes bacterium Pla133]QDV04422.1 Yqey-like protein [Planctomycetes bacterium Pla86]
MTLQERIDADLKTAMRAKDVLTRDTLRMVIAALKNRRIELGQDLGDDEVVAVLAKSVKSREDSALEYDKGGRPELAQKERAEAQVLAGYLPQQLTEDETREVVRTLIAELGIADKKDIGKLMKAVMAAHKGKVDGKLVNRFASELIG